MRRYFFGITLFLAMMSTCSCASKANENTSDAIGPLSSDSTDATQLSQREIIFNVDSAMAFLIRQVNFGPRVPGSHPHSQCADWLVKTLEGMGGQVNAPTQKTIHPDKGEEVPVRNIFAQFNPSANNRILLVAHYDTRPWADEDPDETKHKTPIDGANDGASGVAVGLELARLSNHLSPSIGLDILFVDQEDSGSYGNDNSWCLGSRLWASEVPYSPVNLPAFGILLDMVGGKDAVFLKEQFSEMYAPAINNVVWSAAATTGYGNRFVNRTGGAINDDHLPLLEVGIPTIDIIETTQTGFNPTWHTMADNIENIDPATIEAVGNVLTHIIYSTK